MDILRDRKLFKNQTPNYKRTTEKQYSLLKSKLLINLYKNVNIQQNNTSGILKNQKNNFYWIELTEKLNDLGPPYRTMQQWKKVWCDFKRAERKRNYNSTPEVIKQEEESYEKEFSEIPRSSRISEATILKENCNAMHTTYLYSNLNEHANEHFVPHPALHSTNLSMVDQTIYTLQNQVEHQEKLLEHLQQIYTTIAGLMVRQVDAVEMQTETIHRQALATERQTTFMHNLRNLMCKGTATKGSSIDDIF